MSKRNGRSVEPPSGRVKEKTSHTLQERDGVRMQGRGRVILCSDVSWEISTAKLYHGNLRPEKIEIRKVQLITYCCYATCYVLITAYLLHLT